MTITRASLVLSGALDIRHRFFRLLAGTEEARIASDRGTRSVLEVLADECEEKLRQHALAVRSQLIIAKASSKQSPEQWGEDLLGPIADRAVSGFTSLSTGHAQIYQQLSSGRRAREDLRYLLYRALNLSLVSHRHELLVSVNTSGALQWETTAFTSKQGRTAAVSVPWLESLGPLRWPLLAHEVGHYFLPDGHESADFIENASTEHQWSSDAFEEIVADAVAQQYFGDAYAFALAREGYLYSYNTTSPVGSASLRDSKRLGHQSTCSKRYPPNGNLGSGRA